MPRKSRRSKVLQSKRKQLRQQLPATPDSPPAATQPAGPAVTAPPASRPASKTALATPRYPYVTAELRSIGILSGIILAILIVLALVLG